MVEKMSRLLDDDFWLALPDNKALIDYGFAFDRFKFLMGDNEPFDPMARMSRDFCLHAVRNYYTAIFSFAVPSKELIAHLATYSRNILEVGAGTGLWARLLKDYGCDVIATDGEPVETRPQSGSFTEVEALDGAEAVARYPGRDLLCVWPYNDDPWLTHAINNLHVGGSIIFIGEGEETCGHPSFHAAISNRGCFEIVEQSRVPMFPHMHDRLMIARKTAPIPASIFRLTKTGRTDSSD